MSQQSQNNSYPYGPTQPYPYGSTRPYTSTATNKPPRQAPSASSPHNPPSRDSQVQVQSTPDSYYRQPAQRSTSPQFYSSAFEIPGNTCIADTMQPPPPSFNEKIRRSKGIWNIVEKDYLKNTLNEMEKRHEKEIATAVKAAYDKGWHAGFDAGIKAMTEDSLSSTYQSTPSQSEVKISVLEPSDAKHDMIYDASLYSRQHLQALPLIDSPWPLPLSPPPPRAPPPHPKLHQPQKAPPPLPPLLSPHVKPVIDPPRTQAAPPNALPNPRPPNPHPHPPTIIPLRTPKACEECRRRKTKCDGKTPTCSVCLSRGLSCHYRIRTRIRKKRSELIAAGQLPSSTKSSATRTPPPRSVLGAPLQTQSKYKVNTGLAHSHIADDEDYSDASSRGEEDEAHAQVLSSVSATHAASPAVEINLYYGPSSNFSFLQQIHRRLCSLSSRVIAKGRAAIPGSTLAQGQEENEKENMEQAEAGLRRFNYGGLFFGQRGEHERIRANMPSSELNVAGQGLEVLMGKAEVYMDSFLATSFQLVRFWDEADFRVMMGRFEKAHCLEKAVVLAALALGATVTKNTEDGEALADEAKRIQKKFDEVVNLRTIQVGLLLGYYQIVVGRPSSAYLIVGASVRKGLAAGMHKESAAVKRMEQMGQSKSVEERRATFWCCYVLESIICFAFGRPLSLNLIVTDCPIPTSRPHYNLLVAVIELSKIQHRSWSMIYSGQQRSLTKLYKSALRICTEIDDLCKTVDPAILLNSGDIIKSGHEGVKQIIFYNLIQHTRLLIFRPFLLFRAMLNNTSTSTPTSTSISASSHPASASNSTTPATTVASPTLSGTPATTSAKIQTLLSACHRAVQTARNTISTVSTACQQNHLVRSLGFNGFYMESASFVLVYAATLNDEGLRTRDVAGSLKTAEECLRDLEKGFPLKQACQAVGSMLWELEWLEKIGGIDGSGTWSTSEPKQSQSQPQHPPTQQQQQQQQQRASAWIDPLLVGPGMGAWPSPLPNPTSTLGWSNERHQVAPPAPPPPPPPSTTPQWPPEAPIRDVNMGLQGGIGWETDGTGPLPPGGLRPTIYNAGVNYTLNDANTQSPAAVNGGFRPNFFATGAMLGGMGIGGGVGGGGGGAGGEGGVEGVVRDDMVMGMMVDEELGVMAPGVSLDWGFEMSQGDFEAFMRMDSEEVETGV